MDQRWMRLLATALCVLLFSRATSAQAVASTVLQVDVENFVRYVEDIPDPSRFATSPAVTPAAVPRNFGEFIAIADIVAVNGQAAKGTYLSRGRTTTLSPAPGAGVAIADATRTGAVDTRFEIFDVDGTPIGTILTVEFGGGPPPPGAPLAITQGNNVIVGGSGAYLGARGTFGQAVTPQSVATRQASMVEDPANRRRNGGGKTRFVLQVIPTVRPEVVITSGAPSAWHADLSPVTAAKPAAAGEVLILMATGLGPVRPGVDPGQPFPSSPLQVVNSPVDVVVNGTPATVINVTGWPGLTETYRVEFRVPAGTVPSGMGFPGVPTAPVASIYLRAAWITGAAVSIPVR